MTRKYTELVRVFEMKITKYVKKNCLFFSSFFDVNNNHDFGDFRNEFIVFGNKHFQTEQQQRNIILVAFIRISISSRA